MGAPVTSTPVATSGHSTQFAAAATLGALGVVYGDIGTSPLYALKEAARAATHGGPLTPDAVLGVVSLILWALILIISIKYALLILRADNRGEGGIVALLALLHARHAPAGTFLRIFAQIPAKGRVPLSWVDRRKRLSLSSKPFIRRMLYDACRNRSGACQIW